MRLFSSIHVTQSLRRSRSGALRLNIGGDVGGGPVVSMRCSMESDIPGAFGVWEKMSSYSLINSIISRIILSSIVFLCGDNRSSIARQ